MDFMWSLIHSALKSEYFKAAVSKCVKLQRARVGIESADVSHNSSPCLGDAASLFYFKGDSRVPAAWQTCWRSSQPHLLQVLPVNICPSMEAGTGTSALGELHVTQT